jgi:predicted unusual protein kinase regulating ubiquinone biosynthesis (AarF/ABC1/UbiB family)
MLPSRRMAKDPPDKVPGRFMRTIKTAWLGGTVGSSYLGGRLLDKLRGDDKRAEAEVDRHVTNARRIVTTMTELRGPLMKVGQLLSTHAEALPGQYGEILRSLQSSAPPMSYATIKDVIELDLGATPDELFDDFSREAVAAASLGQVHKARLKDGTPVAVKVQYPGADASVEGDLKNLKFGAAMVKNLLANLVGNQRLDMTPVADEIAEHLAQETDYCREAYNAKLLGRLFRDDPDIVIPRVHNVASGLRVVTYDWIDGVDLNTALKNPDEGARRRVVELLNHAFWYQMFRGGMLHADPHPGNYRMTPDGRLAVLDFGCVKIFDEAFLREFGNMVRARLEGDAGRLKACMHALGLMEDMDSAEELADMEQIARYFSIGLHEDTEFDFGSYSYVRGAKDLVLYFLNRRRVPPAQKDFLFMTRVVLGYYEYFSRARIKMNFRRAIEPYVRDGWRGREVEIPRYGE